MAGTRFHIFFFFLAIFKQHKAKNSKTVAAENHSSQNPHKKRTDNSNCDNINMQRLIPILEPKVSFKGIFALEWLHYQNEL